MENSVKSKFISGVIWGIVEKFAGLFVGFIITIVLARILTPADYGLVNMIYIFTVLGTVLLDGGFGQALIQRKNITDKDISSVFYINIIMSLLVYGLLYMCAPLIAGFYRQPALIPISKVVFLTIPINAFCIIQHTLLTKELQVKKLTYVSIISSVISGLLGIMLAYMDYGVWALVCQSVSYQLVRSISLWFFSKWRPILEFSLSFIRSIFSFSMNLLGVFTLAAIFQNIYTVLIGKIYNVTDVGFYNQAFRLQNIASTSVTSAIDRVTFPAFSKFQDDISKLKSVYKKITVLTMSIYFPFMMCLTVVSENLVEVLLTSKWLPSVPLFCLLCIAEAFYPLRKLNSAVLKALGKGKSYFRLNFINYAISAISIVASYKFGIFYLLVGYAVSTLVCSLLNMLVCGRAIKYNLLEQIKDLLPVFGQTIIVCVAANIGNLISVSALWQLIISIVIGVAVFIILNIVGNSLVYRELKNIKRAV